jgi:hypothetical protein
MSEGQGRISFHGAFMALYTSHSNQGIHANAGAHFINHTALFCGQYLPISLTPERALFHIPWLLFGWKNNSFT